MVGKNFPLSVVFWGYSNSGLQTYRYIRDSDLFKILGIVLPSNREHETISQIKEDAKKCSIDVFVPSKLKDKLFFKSLSALKPEMYIVDSYTKLIPRAIIDIVGSMAFNLPPGLLPT